jgi:hypothetical protein
MWVPNNKPLFDLFDELKPDIFICHIDFISPIIDDVLQEYSDTKFVGLSDSMFAMRKQPDLMCLETNTMYDPFHPLDHYNGPRLSYDVCANPVLFKNGKYTKELATDILYISNYQNPREDVVLSILRFLSKKYQIKVFGNHRLHIPEYLGILDAMEISNAMASAKLTLDIFDSNRFDYAINKLCCLYNNGQYDNPDIWPTYNTLDQLSSSVDLLLKEENKRVSLAKKAYNYVKDCRTYFHYCYKFFVLLGMQEEADKCLDKVKEIL